MADDAADSMMELGSPPQPLSDISHDILSTPTAPSRARDFSDDVRSTPLSAHTPSTQARDYSHDILSTPTAPSRAHDFSDGVRSTPLSARTPSKQARDYSDRVQSTPVVTLPSQRRRGSNRFSPLTNIGPRRSSPRRQTTPQRAPESSPPHHRAALESPATALPTQPRTEKAKVGRRRNGIWEFYDSDHEGGNLRAKCKLCKELFTNPKPAKYLRPHLLIDCPRATSDVRAAVRNLGGYSTAQTDSTRATTISTDLPSSQADARVPLTEAVFQMAVAQCVYACALPHAIVESVAFKDFIAVVAPGMRLPTRQRLGEDLLALSKDRVREEVKAMINRCRYVSIVTDGWTDTNGASIINFMVVAPGIPSLFWSSWATHSIEHTAEYFAREMERVIDDIQRETTAVVTAIVTDNASVMRKAWKDVHKRRPHVIGGGCAAHVLNLLMGDVCKDPSIFDVRAKTLAVIRFVRDHVALLDQFKTAQVENRQAGVEAPGLVLPVPTRWYSLYNSLRCVSMNRSVISKMFRGADSTKFLKRYRKRATTAKKLDNVRAIVADDQFWENLATVVRLTEPIVEALGKLESDTTFLSAVYNWFRALKFHHVYGATSEVQLDLELREYQREQARQAQQQDPQAQSDPVITSVDGDCAMEESRAIQELEGEEPPPPCYIPSQPIVHRELQRFFRIQIQERWQYVHTSAMGVAFLLDPSKDLEDFVGNDFDLAQAQVFRLGKDSGLILGDEMAALNAEILAFADMKREHNFVPLHSCTNPRHYWNNSRRKYPLLCKIADVVFAIPPSSAASERAWSIFDHIHTKKRNRLSTKKVESLAFIYINQGVIKNDKLDMARHISRPESL